MSSFRPSVGGAAGAHGVGFQDEVFPWAATAMLAEQVLPKVFVPGTVTRVGAQTGFAIDDVAVETGLGGLALFQAKTGLSLGSAEDSPLAGALDQVVDQYLTGVPSNGGTSRPRRGTHPLVIVTDATAPKTVRQHLAAAISRTAGLPTGIPLGAQLTQEENRALGVALTHVRRSWADHGGRPSDEDIRELLGVLAVLALDTTDGGPDRAAAVVTLAGVVPAEGESQAWQALGAVGHEAAENRQWSRRPTLVTALARRGVVVGPGPTSAGDIAVLRAATESNLDALQPHTTLPVAAGIHLPRIVDAPLAAATAEEGVLVVGDAGSGKTGLAVTLAAARAAAGEDLVLLRAADLAAGEVAGGVRLDRPFDRVLLAWTGSARATLVIDALDAARGSDDRARLAQLVTSLASSRWQVIATMRTYDILYSPTLRDAFSGPALTDDPERLDPRLDGVRHVLVGDFTEAELAPVTESATPLAGFYVLYAGDLDQVILVR